MNNPGYYILKGSFRFTVNDESAELSAGDVCVVPKGDRFHYANVGSSDGMLILLHTPDFHLECEGFEE
jgi:mannose-6-phosphate isomerase-like protein (cupin superfamily)